ncbi:T9SS type A sorting domain-containing protein [Tenacibaculum agarivorans]|uniref:T9SS type A sorting domain-containing protein n=1 Tax=Tenacibaculum agarivorans TaxID=1908389 RepID=UPI0009F828D8|nr:T9SS type A sorting domain-containing protein [Tenacibaculum agarivorans]
MRKFHLLFLFLFYSYLMFSQVNVDINFDVNHILGSVDSFNREKFINCHSGPSDNDFNGELDKLDYLINDLDVYFGRETGRMRFQVNQVKEDPSRTGFADPSDITRVGTQFKNNYANSTVRHAYEKGRMMTAAQDVPFYPNGHTATSQGWFFSQSDTSSEPFGTALGEYMGRFLRDAHGNGSTTGNVKPIWVEVMNEPIWPLVDFNLHGGATIDDVFKMHETVADQIRIYSPDTKIGGWATAFPDLEKVGRTNTNAFGQWEERWKRFIDEVGPKMDFYSIHVYDFPGISNGLEQYRKGSNMEATMDMIEHYNTIKYGSVKPWVISEYGSQLNDWYNQPWSAFRDWLFLKAQSSMMMQFMERADVIEKAIPFSVMKAEWGFGNFSNNGVPYYWRMMRRENEPSDYSGDWIWTDYIKFFELWSDVKGKRIDTRSTDPDLMVDAYIDGNKAYLILNNIDENNINVNLNSFGLNGIAISSTKIKHLYLGLDNTPKLDITTVSTTPENITVGEEGCMIIEYTFSNPVTINETSKEVKTYASTYKQTISSSQPVNFTISNIKKGTFGEAILRLGIGREKSKKRVPISIIVNGSNTITNISSDYRGDDQQDRPSFFGVLEIPVPYNFLVDGDNTIAINFDDDGGFISSCALQTFEFSKDINRSSTTTARTRSITFNNRADYFKNGSTVPIVEFGQEMSINVTYATGIDASTATEEDLIYVATLVRQIDEKGAAVNSSTFTVSVPDSADNTGTLTYNYTIPTTFDDGTTIPSSSELPTGHQLLLIVFMSVDNNANFANANDVIQIEKKTLSTPDIEKTENTIELYPNPSSDIVTIKGKFKSWRLYSTMGQLLLTGKEKEINVAKLASGTYFITFNNIRENLTLIKK